jgi:SPP1 gp7 family putative phage head morphogenesis protein
MKAADIQAVLDVIDWSDISADLQTELQQATLAGASDALLGGDIDDADLISKANEGARDYASERAAELVGSGGQSIAETTREKLRSILTQSFESETNANDLIADIQTSGIFSEARATTIARTEVNRAELGGNIAAWKEMGNVELVDWVNGEDACDECQDYEDNGPYTLKEAEELLDDTHPNCRCGLVPHTSAEAEE